MRQGYVSYDVFVAANVCEATCQYQLFAYSKLLWISGPAVPRLQDSRRPMQGPGARARASLQHVSNRLSCHAESRGSAPGAAADPLPHPGAAAVLACVRRRQCSFEASPGCGQPEGRAPKVVNLLCSALRAVKERTLWKLDRGGRGVVTVSGGEQSVVY